LVPDSNDYIRFQPYRTAGYPLFLMLTGTDAIRFVQPVIAALCLFILYWESRKLFSNCRLIATGLIIAIGANMAFFPYHYSIITESLYVSLLSLVVAIYMRYARSPSNLSVLALLSILCGLCISIRPAALFLLPALFIGVVLVWSKIQRGKFRTVLVCVLPLLAVYSAEKTFSSIWHDGNSSSLLTRHLFAKAALIDGPSKIDESSYGKILENDYHEVRQFLWSAPGFTVRNHFLPDYEICLQYACLEEHGANINGSPLARSAALERIKSNMPGYLKLSWHNYRSLWTVFPSSTPSATRQINSYLKVQSPIPYARLLPTWLSDELVPEGSIKFVIQLGILFIGIVSIVLILYGAFQWIRTRALHPIITVTVFASLSLHGSLLLTAMTGVSANRYLISCWPLLMVILAGIAALLWMGWKSEKIN
jgi:hypothetical protein